MPEINFPFSNKLITWYLQNKRELPWRQTKDPYRIWLSEIILQQTRVAQGLPYYETFVATYPNVYELAKAPEEDVLKLWQGLGYYSRARNLRFTANFVANELNGVFPNTYESLKKLKGVGDYTASAIASICYQEPAAVVDGNVYRVLSRVFGVATPINSTAGIKEFKLLAQTLLDEKQPGVFNQAIMEFGARYCVPQNPACEGCIFSENCMAFTSRTVSELPVKLKKLKVKKRYFNYIVLLSIDHKTRLNQRLGKGIWQNLYEFPLVETTNEVSEGDLKREPAYRNLSEEIKINSIVKYNDTPIVHKLSHQHLITTFWIVETETLHGTGIAISEIEKFPVPVLIANFLNMFTFQ
ncbi:A/G-specific adenine glycosylase [Rasiella rasia]|uniref:Adenine DNA glycosylase n=1 Tax=Rasiella rasia TaxID=2744027 RepID=A0A6G6GPB5_9FLAO|nr:A/G-specific adenine glycosylase [Rasiella rasia]QIE59551.1 A/G-specific adenine glycosylase [Rasiella rasia]